MKTKKSKRKLALNKILIANLENDRIAEDKGELLLIKGGAVIIDSVATWCTTCWPPPECLSLIEETLIVPWTILYE